MKISHIRFLIQPYKVFLSSKNCSRCSSFFFLCFFSSHTFVGLHDPRRESQNLYLKHSFSTYTSLSNNSLISAWISTKFVSTLLLCIYLKHSFSTYTSLSNNSLISAWISIKFVSTLLLCMVYQTNSFQHKSRYLNVFERYFCTACCQFS